MWLKFQQHAHITKPESNANSVVCEPNPITDANPIAKSHSVAESYSNGRCPIGLISGDVVFPGWQKRVAPRDDYR
jgi:hypothetical protein